MQTSVLDEYKSEEPCDLALDEKNPNPNNAGSRSGDRIGFFEARSTTGCVEEMEILEENRRRVAD